MFSEGHYHIGRLYRTQHLSWRRLRLGCVLTVEIFVSSSISRTVLIYNYDINYFFPSLSLPAASISSMTSVFFLIIFFSLYSRSSASINSIHMGGCFLNVCVCWINNKNRRYATTKQVWWKFRRWQNIILSFAFPLSNTAAFARELFENNLQTSDSSWRFTKLSIVVEE